MATKNPLCSSSSSRSSSVCSLSSRESQTSIRNFFVARQQHQQSDKQQRQSPRSLRRHVMMMAQPQPPCQAMTPPTPRAAAATNQPESPPIPAAFLNSTQTERCFLPSLDVRADVAASTHVACDSPQHSSLKRSGAVATPVNITYSGGGAKKKMKKHQQLYLDLGQRNFAANTECGVCGMLFVHGLVEDAQRHKAVCQDYVQGVAFHFTQKQQQLRVLRKWTLQSGKQEEWDQKQRQQATIIEVRLRVVALLATFVCWSRFSSRRSSLFARDVLTLIGFMRPFTSYLRIFRCPDSPVG